jgi:nitrate/nitrite-specific signal transduction histidine kinase
LNYKTDRVQLGIRDDGAGFDTKTAPTENGGHFGLLNMRERAEKIGAHFSLTTQPGKGTEIIVTVTGATSIAPVTYSPKLANLAALANGKLDQT